MDKQDKLTRLKNDLSALGSVIVAYSGGIDSTLLARVAHDVLGEKALAVTGVSASVPQSELLEARRIAREIGIRHIEIETGEFNDPRYLENPPERCYFCKQDVYTRIQDLARQEGITHVLDGANADDAADFRPGRKAALEKGLRSPLAEAGFTKSEIRSLARELGLPNWDKPSAACLASRIPYGSPIDVQVLRRIEDAEAFLRELGFRQVRVRYHNQVARIEVEGQEIERLVRERAVVAARLKDLGFLYVTLDLEGFRSGSMNEGLAKNG